MNGSAIGHLTSTPLGCFGLWLATVLALNWAVLDQPPVWDSTGSIFPAALYLVDHDFDLFRLFQEPGYFLAGPNVHAYSVMTHLTAGVYALTGGGPWTFPILHALQFAMTAWALTHFVLLTRTVVGPLLAWLLSLLVLLFPVFLTQTRYMYLEIPLFLCTVAALRGFVDQSLWRTVVWSALACMIKEAGVVVGVVAAALWLLDTGTPRVRLTRFAAALAPVAIFVFLHTRFVLGNADVSVDPQIWQQGGLAGAVSELGRCWKLQGALYLSQIPDVTAIVAGAAVIGTATLRRLWPERSVRAALVLVVAFLGFHFLAVPATGLQCDVLPRYFVQILPFALLVLLWCLQQVTKTDVAVGVLLVAIAGVVVNRNGALYPGDLNPRGLGAQFAITERSGAYRMLLDAQRGGLAFQQHVPTHVPIYNELHNHYIALRPRMGYVDQTLHNSRYIQPEFLRRGQSLDAFPNCFTLNYFSPYLGGTSMRALLDQAQRLPHWQAEPLARASSGPYHSTLVKFWRDDTPCLANWKYPED
ncbi:hypothetical protein MK489_07555 [Myxococcota bacterium]|nr:hypothetical protein [Myxococcota bacterium]